VRLQLPLLSAHAPTAAAAVGKVLALHFANQRVLRRLLYLPLSLLCAAANAAAAVFLRVACRAQLAVEAVRSGPGLPGCQVGEKRCGAPS